MLIWGSVGIFARWIDQEPLVTVTYRLLFGAGALGLVELWSRRSGGRPAESAPRDARLRQVGLLVLSGLALALNWLFFFKALAATSVSNAVLSYYMAPVIVALTAPLLLREKLEGRTLLATALSFGGLVLMLAQDGLSLTGSDATGILYGLIAACFYASVTILGRWLSAMPAARLVLVQCVVAASVLLPFTLYSSGGAALGVPGPALSLLAVVGVVHTAFALFLYFHGMRTVKVQHVGVLAYLDPVSAVLFAYLFLGELPTGGALAGGLLILAGSALLLRRPG